MIYCPIHKKETSAQSLLPMTDLQQKKQSGNVIISEMLGSLLSLNQAPSYKNQTTEQFSNLQCF